jgi:dienelactone hydrolase
MLMLLVAAWPAGHGGLMALAYAADSSDGAAAPSLHDRFNFNYEKKPIVATDKLNAALATKRYRVHSLSYPSIGENGQANNLVTALYYQSKLPGKHELVIVLPIWGTHTYPPRKMTASLMSYSDGEVNVLRILGRDYLLDWKGMNAVASEKQFVDIMYRMAERVRTNVIDIRRAVDWAEAQPEIDPKRIGLIGFSMSANVAAVVIENDPRISATALVMGGANPQEMFGTCFGRARTLRENITKRFSWTKAQYEHVIEKPFAPVNAAQFAGRVDPRHVIIFEAAYDTCIPKSGRDALWHAMGEPKRIKWPWNHKMAFLMMSPLGLNTMRHEIFDFMQAELNTEAQTMHAASTRGQAAGAQ